MTTAPETSPEPLADELQDGIFFRSGESPPPCYRLLLLNFAAGVQPESAADAMTRVVAVAKAFQQRGHGSDLPVERAASPPPGPESGWLSVLLAFGARLFEPEAHDPPLTAGARPRLLRTLESDDRIFFSLPFAREPESHLAQADVALQFLGQREDGVNRAVVEVWKEIVDRGLPLEIVATFSAFQRADGRGWLEFHDGISNLPTSQRRVAIEVTSSDPPWMRGGTYMAFLRLEVDLALWRALPPSEQEVIVGRQKLSGCPLVDVVVEDGKLDSTPLSDCPPSADSSPGARAAYVDPPSTGRPLVEASHIHRANQNRGAPDKQANFRIFRQGYDFLDGFRNGRPVVGLNFVSFQAGLDRLLGLLQTQGWLGDVNFGGPLKPGPGEPTSPELMSITAGGFYAVPRRAEPFPGAEVFVGS